MILFQLYIFAFNTTDFIIIETNLKDLIWFLRDIMFTSVQIVQDKCIMLTLELLSQATYVHFCNIIFLPFILWYHLQPTVWLFKVIFKILIFNDLEHLSVKSHPQDNG